MSFGIRANDTATSAESENEDRDEPDDNRGIEHLLGTIESSGACIYTVWIYEGRWHGTAFNSLDRQQDEACDKVRPPVRTPYPTGKLEPLTLLKQNPTASKNALVIAASVRPSARAPQP